MTLEEFHSQLLAEISTEVGDRMGSSPYPYPESVFCETVMEHMAEAGMTFGPRVCHLSRKSGNATLRVSGYAVSDDAEQLDLFVSLYSGSNVITPVPDADTKAAAEQCLRFLAKCAEGKLAASIDPSDEAHDLVLTIQDCYRNLDQISIYVLTDGQVKTKNFKPRDIEGKTVRLEVMDIERLFRHTSEGRPRDELVVNFEETCGAALPCVYVPAEGEEYDYALTAIPGAALRLIYEKYGSRLLEANVRSFLNQTGKVNKGIRDTLRNNPERFMAYNNGIVIIADNAHLARTPEGGTGIAWLSGMQIVNGGQTTASIYFTKKKYPDTSLARVRVPAKIIVLHSASSDLEEALISDISRFANSQNAVKVSDLSANKPFHIELEKLALSTYCPDGVGRWFYERAAGSYNTMLAREGTTPARLRQLRETVPSARKLTKTDLAKYLNAWDQKPHLVSLGSQKNFEAFMDQMNDSGQTLPDVTWYKSTIAKIILFKAAQKAIRPAFPAFQANITAYTVSLLANRYSTEISLDGIWQQQDVPPELLKRILEVAKDVSASLHRTARSRMISEWAKKADCWKEILGSESLVAAG